jgi:3-methylcrotonyl-CoA carboxylase alpha subunit
MHLRLKTLQGVRELQLRGDAARREFVLDDVAYALVAGRCGNGTVEFTLDGRRRRAWVVAEGDARHVFLDGRVCTVHLHGEDAADATDDADGGGPELRTRLPGKVVRILVREGEAVRAGQPLLILEAMKMETEITAARAGRVERIRCAEGEVLGPDAPLLDLLHDPD